MTIVLTTTIDKGSVTYAVLQQGFVRWERKVSFKRTPSHRPGGWAFRQAARDQEDFADRLVQQAGLQHG